MTKSNSMENFFTRDLAEKGKKFFINGPDGEITDQWLVIRHVDSDTFRNKNMECLRKLRESGGKAEGLDNELLSCLIVDWSFDEEANEANIIKFLDNAPYIANQLNKLSADRKAFFTKGESCSQTMPSGTST